jgi:GNAT superfamily N-acetyltransferase
MEEIDNIDSILACVPDRFVLHFGFQSWGKEILIMEKEGRAFARVYWYNDDNATVFLDWLNVDEKARKQGIGTTLQEIREKIGFELGAKKAMLLVDKTQWMHKWYRRRGYKETGEQERGFIWMEKVLKAC